MTVRIVRPLTAFALSSGKRKRPRLEDDTHLRFIRGLPCLVTGKRDHIEAAHIRYGDVVLAKRETGKGEKPSDLWTVPLHTDEHRLQHTMNEQEYWKSKGINPLHVALALYANSGDDEAAEVIIREARKVLERA